MSFDRNDPGDKKQVDKDQNATAKKTVTKIKNINPFNSAEIPEEKEINFFGSDSAWEWESRKPWEQLRPNLFFRYEAGDLKLIDSSQDPVKRINIPIGLYLNVALVCSKEDPLVLTCVDTSTSTLTQWIEDKEAGFKKINRMKLPYIGSTDKLEISEIEKGKYVVLTSSMKELKSKLTLIDSTSGKVVQKIFPDSYFGYVVLNKKTIGLYASGEGLALVDLSFDSKKGPSCEPHKQQPTIAIKNNYHIHAGQDFWLTFDGKSLVFYQVRYQDEKFQLQKRADILGDKGALFGDETWHFEASIIEGKYFLLYRSFDPKMFFVKPDTGQVIELNIPRDPGDCIVHSGENNFQISVIGKNKITQYDLPNPNLFSQLGQSLHEIGKMYSGGEFGSGLHERDIAPGVLDILSSYTQDQPDSFRPALMGNSDKDKKEADEPEISLNFIVTLRVLISHLEIRIREKEGVAVLQSTMKNPPFEVSHILKKLPELDQLLWPRKEGLKEKFASIPAFFKKDKSESEVLSPLSDENQRKLLLIHAALQKILKDCQDKKPRTIKELKQIYEETLGTETFSENRAFFEKLLSVIEATANMLDERMIQGIRKGR